MTQTGAVIPRATYRLQLHKGFDFDAARAVLPYLQRLGVSHVYCSPISTAQPGSLHGYDVVDPTRINLELGGREGFERFAAAARALGMGLLLDLVPNHMGVSATTNPWWADVIENGRASEFAGYFDIDWAPANPALRGKLMVPVLGSAYGEALDAGEITVVFDAAQGRFSIAYGPLRFALDPRTYATVLRAGAAPMPAWERLAQAFEALPARDDGDPLTVALRRSTQGELRAQLAREAAQDADAAAALAQGLDRLNGADQRDALDALHDAQAFRLAYWRSAADDINYRRFFDVNELVALRVEDERVFEATQGIALDLAAAGLVDGLRIDHPDGLLEPAEFFDRLQRGYASRRGIAPPAVGAGAGAGPLYVVAEKITATGEDLPDNWAVHGTTGYRFAAVVGGLFVERGNAARMERVWRAFTGIATDFDEIVRTAKLKAAREALSAQLTGLAHALQRIALAHRHSRDHSFNSLRDALAEVAAAMPVYRTYVARTGPPSAQDRRFIDQAIAEAARHGDPADAALYAFVRRCLLGETATDDPALAPQVRDFAMRFQQFSAPVAAKGVEDTAFYRYYRLASLNEVGGDPGVFGMSAADFHRASASRAAQWPHTLLATSTHDNKRAEDVRNRISVLSERPAEWRLALRRWRASTRRWCTRIDGIDAPSAVDQYLLHQTLLGTLPAGGLTETDLPGYRERIEQHMLKASREAKVHTSWASRRPAYETALVDFVRGLLGSVDGNAVLAGLQARASELAWLGALNSLAMTLIKFASPGVPDIYQGTETMDLSLVDPDNRRAVDYASRDRCLAAFEAVSTIGERGAEIARLAATPTDGRLKLWLTWRLLSLRRERRALFDSGQYLPLRVTGSRRRHVIAFARRGADATLIVIAGRKFSGLGAVVEKMPIGSAVWGDTAIRPPAWLVAPLQAEDVFSGALHAWPAGPLLLADAFEVLPLAAFVVPHGGG